MDAPPLQPLLPVLAGPTGVGKTALSLSVADALDAEIVSADSMAVYRGLEVATAKPSREERARVPHHLVDVIDSSDPFSVADFVCLARDAISGIRSRGRLPLVVGGTRQYVDALTLGFVKLPPSDPDTRRRLEREAGDSGLPALRSRLEQADPDAAARIHPNDLRRTVRALEVLELTGRTITSWQRDSRLQPPFRRLLFGLTMDRERLYARINTRVDAMMSDGLADEVGRLLASGALGPTALQGHGYKEIAGALHGQYPIERGVYLLKRNTRWHARHQLMWLRRQPDTVWVDLDEGLAAAERLVLNTVQAAQR